MKLLGVFTLIVVVLLPLGPAYACEGKMEKKAEKLRERLDLTDAQMEEVTDIFSATFDKFDCWSKETRQEKRKCRRSAKKEIAKEIESILNEDQLTEFQELKEERRARREK